ncbi:MAG: acyltransferase [Bacteroidaceae bacterium]|nr:acyltransferase [Bacteroidaceae bacterium]
MKPRNHAFDLLCGLCIVRMVMLHVVGICHLRGEYHFGKLMAWTFFFLSFFFFKAGYFNKTVSGDSLSFVRDKARRLLIPYLMWGLIGNAVFFGFLYGWPRVFAGTMRRINWSHLWEASQFYGNPPVWFLFSFFMMYVVVHFWRRFMPRVNFVWPLLPLLSYWLFTQGNPLWMSLSNLPMGVFFFELGHWWHEAERRVPRGWFLALSCLLVMVFLYGNRHWHGEYDMALNKWVQRPWGAVVNSVCVLCGLSGVLLSLPMRRVPLLGFIGEHSMVFFVMHYPLIYLYRMGMMVAGVNIRGQWFHVCLMLALVFPICLALVSYFEKIGWLSGRWRK